MLLAGMRSFFSPGARRKPPQGLLESDDDVSRVVAPAPFEALL
jgi:hypothetical protein